MGFDFLTEHNIVTVSLPLPGEADTHQRLHDSHNDTWLRADMVLVNGGVHAFFVGPRLTKSGDLFANGQRWSLPVELAPQLYAEHRALIWVTAQQHYRNMVLKFQHMVDTAERELQ